MPKTRGVFHYTGWRIGNLTEEHRSQLARSFTYMDLCTGLGTTLIVHEAIRLAMARRGLNINGQCTGLTESDKDRREALGRRLGCLGLNAPIKNRNADLSDDLSDMCLADLLFMGIVCTDISSCTSTPKSLNDPLGSIGASWMPFLAYFDKLPVEDRLKVIVLECVANLGANRAIEGRTEKGTKLVVDALRERCYEGEWRNISATRFCLPHSRPRVCVCGGGQWGSGANDHGGRLPRRLSCASTVCA